MEDTSVLNYEIMVGTEECDFSDDQKHEIKSEQSLVKASAIGNYEKVLKLLSSGVLVDADEYRKVLFYASKNYMTPLQLAAANGHLKCAQILIDHGADVNAKDRFDVTALHMAAEKGNYLCLKALIDAGADCCLPTKFSKTGCYRAVPHLGGTTPLHLAAANNHIDCVKELIQYGADYNAIDECGRTSLYIASNLGFSECVLAHLKNAVGRDILSLPDFEASDTPLHFAVFHKMTDCVRELLLLGSDVNHINILGCSPLHIALLPSVNKGSNMEILKLLILEGYNTDINLYDAGGYTPLHYVCFNGQSRNCLKRPEMAKFLIAYGADVNIKYNNHGLSLLQCELNSPEKEYEVLKYIVNSMLQLPHLNVLMPHLNTSSHRESLPSIVTNRYRNPNLENEILAHYPLPFNAGDRATVTNRYRNPNLENEILAHYPLPFNAGERDINILWNFRVRHQNFPDGRMHVRNTHFNVPDFGHVYDTYEGNMFLNEERNASNNEEESNWGSFFLGEKKIWYEQMASNPRTLQHCCRFIVRKTLGSSRLKDVRKLPIPAKFKSYILLDCDV